jgi:hypothetical protein
LAYGNLLIGTISDTCESCIKLIVGNVMGRISVELSDELEKKLRFKTVERFGGKKGDLSKAVEEAVKIWVAKE